MSEKGQASGLELSGEAVNLDYSDQNTVIIKDRSGHSLRYQEFGGVLYAPIYKASNLKAARTFPMRTDDVYFTGYPRTGTNWTYEITSMLLNGKAETVGHFKRQIEYVPLDVLHNLPSPRIIHGHLKLSDSPRGVTDMKIKVLYTFRDPKDVAVSCYKLYYGRPITSETYKGSFEDFLDLFMQGKVDNNGPFEHIRDAEKFIEDNPDVPFHFQIYEDTIKDPVQSIQNLSDFLGLTRDDVLCQAIAEKCEFSKMKADKDKFTVTFDGESFIYRKGVVGDWRNYFTEEMLEKYYRVYEEKMAGSRFYQRYAREKL